MAKQKSEDKLEELRLFEANLQQIFLQKQAFQIELSETEMALKEIKESGEEVFKIVGQLMIKTQKEKIIDELSNKKKILELRIISLEKQEKSVSEKVENLREEMLK